MLGRRHFPASQAHFVSGIAHGEAATSVAETAARHQRACAVDEGLPDVLLTKVTGHLNRAELLRARTVSKRWKSASERHITQFTFHCESPAALRQWLATSSFPHMKAIQLNHCEDRHLDPLTESLRWERRIALRSLTVNMRAGAMLSERSLRSLGRVSITTFTANGGCFNASSISHLAAANTLTTLKLVDQSCTLEPDMFRVLSAFPVLANFVWDGHDSTSHPDQGTVLPSIACQTLKMMSLSVRHVAPALKHLSLFPNLQSLRIRGVGTVSDAAFAGLTSAASLHTLAIERIVLMAADGAAFAAMPALGQLKLFQCFMCADAAQALTNSRSLRTLTVADMLFDEDAFSTLMGCSSVVSFEYSARRTNGAIDPDDRKQLNALLLNSHLRRLRVKHEHLTIAAAIGFASKPNLDELIFTIPPCTSDEKAMVEKTWSSFPRREGARLDFP